MATNSAPIYSGQGDIQGGDLLLNAAADYSGQNVNNAVVFTSNGTYGGYIQKIRFKANATNIATVARIYINNGSGRLASSSAAATTPSGSLVTTGGNLLTGSSGANYYAKIVAVDQYGGITAASTESTVVANATSSTTGSITWTWTAVAGAKSYRIYVGPVTNGQLSYFSSNASPYVQTEAIGVRDSVASSTNNFLYGEISLPATTAIATAATVDIDYPMNFALAPGQRVIVGLGNAVANGWYVTGIGGSYAPIA